MIEESNVAAIIATAAILAPTLGPCGLDKLLVDENGGINRRGAALFFLFFSSSFFPLFFSSFLLFSFFLFFLYASFFFLL
jgi:hypothetical protein